MKVAVIGLGYVGISLAGYFSEKHHIIGFDVNKEKVEEYKLGIDRTEEIGKRVNQLGIDFTTKIEDIQEADIILVTVPTPTVAGTIDASYVKKASEMIAPYMKQGAIVVYESTVYPFFTREECIPILEKYSGKECGVDFSVGYSPERVNPGDKKNTIKNITKVVAGYDEETTYKLGEFYRSVIEKVYPVDTLEAAEACKVLENSQRDLNIALINQFAMLYPEIDTNAVVKAMNTKWNALGFTSGLVGGHCIAEDPQYLIHKTRSRGNKFTLLEEARYINEEVPRHIVVKTMELLNKSGKALSTSKILVKGITFKENCPDVRNSKTVTIVEALKKSGAEVIVVDPIVDNKDLKQYYGFEALKEYNDDVDVIIYAVAHEIFKEDEIDINQNIIDVKGIWQEYNIKNYYAL
ncbi:nucleotide sugar dehydrogenase [Bacillus paranthracis]|nr:MULTISPECIES: nucleotide sugar dehydrogenase [Bacillus cereus group]KXI35556.1 hypothetical protein ACS53_27570 [Bacillus cereus]MCR6790677.1 nucleotide sugar dehydrogenase [Bacillus paranthracis]MCU5016895.1 nucleotide sugar dehydrogenase [Bacillus paranthracis]MDA2194208.1 nucleotide sugar dehydrogenase [Bacillus cereus group sp. Bc238]MDA2199953.1 nucleotide sugar dehydrogenase [Bacillus cereus group sp. Bc237]